MRPDDLVLATYRGHGEALAKGCDPVEMMAELMCRATGMCKGKGGSMHLADPARGLISTNAIVAGHIPIAGGVALSCLKRGTGQVVFCFFGDGASCEGEFFETLNMAALWKVPLVFVCENNGWAISVPTAKSQATPNIADRAGGFGIPAAIVDGNDPLAVRAAVEAAAARARSGGGPTFIECKTVRWERHSALSAGADPAAGRAAWQRVDPIPRFRNALLAWSIASEADLQAIDDEAVAEAAHARREAEAAPFPPPGSVHEDVFAPARA
jgi:TPP-dependent pyruvate/acetoin dehydrogenase alpha subunit